jgi:hypothetical protein
MEASVSRVDRYLPRSLIASLFSEGPPQPLVLTVERLEGGCTVFWLPKGSFHFHSSLAGSDRPVAGKSLSTRFKVQAR